MKRTKAAWLTRGSAIALMVAGGIALSACSGGDGLSKAEEEALQEQLEEAEREREEAQREAAEAERQRQEAERQRQEAEREAAEAERQRQAEEAQRQEAERQRQEAEREREEAQQRLTEAEQAELRARAGSFATHLDLGSGGGEEMVTPMVSWPRGGSLTFRPSGTLTAGSAAPSVPGGWRSASFTGQTGTAATLVDETVYLYTNIQPPGTRAFWKVYGLNETMTSQLAPHARGNSATPNADTESGTTGHQYSKLTVSGSLNGADGSFTCDCSGTVGDSDNGINSHVTFSQGTPTFINVGNWTFTPSSLANGYRVDQDDAYLYFGVWSSIPKSISGTGYNFRYMAGGGQESGGDLGRFNALTGSATFRGGAVGRYVTQGQVGGQNAKIGTFTATATLNADFGTTEAAGTLSGSITDFREGGSPLAGWQVTLGHAENIGNPSTIASGAASGSTVANIGGVSVGGSWGATFHGIDNDGGGDSEGIFANRTKYPASQYPEVDLAGVTGWFDATGASVSLAGAFGATPRN